MSNLDSSSVGDSEDHGAWPSTPSLLYSPETPLGSAAPSYGDLSIKRTWICLSGSREEL